MCNINRLDNKLVTLIDTLTSAHIRCYEIDFENRSSMNYNDMHDVRTKINSVILELDSIVRDMREDSEIDVWESQTV